jgi:ADP-L-glycero-D-manno-heptose 6-epimerase
VYAAVGRAPQIAWRDTPETMRDKYQYLTQAQTVRLREAGYTKPFTELEEGIRRYVRDYLSAADPYL